MRRLAVISLATSACAVSALLAMAAAPGCGPSPLSKGYAAYDARAEAILERERPVWDKLTALYLEQGHSETPDPERLQAVVLQESVPFYDAMKGEVAAAAPEQAELAGAQDALVKFAAKRAAFARLVAGNLDVIRRGDPWKALDTKNEVLSLALTDYAERVRGRAELTDQRFALVQNSLQDFQRLCVEPLANGRLTAPQMADIVKTQIQPKIREARATQFEDDENGRSVRAAVVAADEFFDAAQQSAALMEASARVSRESESLAKEGVDLLQKFKDEMKAVRGRM